MYYFPEIWEYYGLTPITVWNVESPQFFSMAGAIDEDRASREKEAREAAKKNKPSR